MVDRSLCLLSKWAENKKGHEVRFLNINFFVRKVLGIQKIGATDNLFELGGNSLSATRLISLIHKEFEVKISINDLFKNGTLEDQAVLIDNIHLAYGVDIDKDKSNVEIEKFYI